MQEEQKFLQQRVESLQKELEVFAERSKEEVQQLRTELNSTQEVLVAFLSTSCLQSCVLHFACVSARSDRSPLSVRYRV